MESHHPVYPVHRTFKVEAPALSAHELEAVKQRLVGIQKLELDAKTCMLSIAYDSGVLVFPDILAHLAEAGVRPVDSRWFRLKLAWYEYTDRNALQLAHERPKACCNKVPKA